MARRRRKPITDPKKLGAVHRAQSAGSIDAVKSDLRSAPPGDQSFGTSPSALGLVKMQSEEARMETCFECGFSAGRHSSRCSRKPADA